MENGITWEADNCYILIYVGSKLTKIFCVQIIKVESI